MPSLPKPRLRRGPRAAPLTPTPPEPSKPNVEVVQGEGLRWVNIEHPTTLETGWLEEHFEYHPLDLEDVVRAVGGEPWTGMPAGTTMGHVHLHVGDLPAAKAFYHGALGFDLVVWRYPGALFLSAGGYHHHLGLNTWAHGAQPARPDDARLIEWEIVLPEQHQVDAAAASMRAAGQDVVSDDDDRLATDPWGTTVRLRAERAGRDQRRLAG